MVVNKLMVVSRRLARRAAGRTEADTQKDIAVLLELGEFDLGGEQIKLESPAPDLRRIDVEVGRTVIEVKRSLDRKGVVVPAEQQLASYVTAREDQFGERYVGLLTDGRNWWMYRRQPSGDVARVATYVHRGDAHALVVWLEGVLATKQAIQPTPGEIEERLGVNSSSYLLDYDTLLAIYSLKRDRPEVQVKRSLWERLLQDALGMGFAKLSDEGKASLFVRHTYLVAIAEMIAHQVIGTDIATAEPQQLMSGALFRQARIAGVVEADFFDWVVDSAEGVGFVRTLARRISRFDFANPDHDVLKVLYESIIDAETRHSLGEYYTPDWIAQQIVDQVIDDPLNQTVLDPACGSGTFLFWALRKYLEVAEAAGIESSDAIRGAAARIMGIDLHPVAVTLARVTVLLAIGTDRLRKRDSLDVQVFLGDSMMWRQPDDLHGSAGITVHTTDGLELFANTITFPEALVGDLSRFDQLVAALTERASSRKPGDPVRSIEGLLKRFAVAEPHREAVRKAYQTLCQLHDERRDHIWGYYIRNLARPYAVARKKVDRLVGNPPWLAYRYMGDQLKTLFKEAMQQRRLWAGGKLATHQDLSGYFVARSTERFLRKGGIFGFVMPAGALKGGQYETFRTGDWSAKDAAENTADLSWKNPWRLVDVKPDPFPVPSCVIFGRRTDQYAVRLPVEVGNWQARFPRGGNLDWNEAKQFIKQTKLTIKLATGSGSPYREDFAEGATLVPRVLLFVEDDAALAIGAGKGRRAVRSRRSSQEKPPWKACPALHHIVEERFIRPVHLGQTVLPYRLLDPLEAIIPWDGRQLLDGNNPEIDLYDGLASWWREAEAMWETNKSAGSELSLLGRIDFQRGLANQFPASKRRVVYTKSGTTLTAAVVRDPDPAIDHILYWSHVSSREEAHYLCGILNSSTLLSLVSDYQPVGQFGPRHFDKYVFEPPFPRFDASDTTHLALAAAAEKAEQVAAQAPVAGAGFQQVRKRIREALREDGIAGQIDTLVIDVLNQPAVTSQPK